MAESPPTLPIHKISHQVLPILLPKIVLFISVHSHYTIIIISPTFLSQNSQWSLCLHFFSVYSQNNLSNNNFHLCGLNLFNGFLLLYDEILIP